MDHNGHRELVDHLFRQEHGRMVAVLTRIFGFDQLELVEDVIQEAFLTALRSWRERVPDNPRAWLVQAARNKAIDWLRRGKLDLAAAASRDPSAVVVSMHDLFHEREISDSQLRLVFACCHPALAERDQIALTLQLASGFGVTEIANALLTNPEAIKKRLQRARSRLKAEEKPVAIPQGAELGRRLQAVLQALYLTFNEGYMSTVSDDVIRRDLCAEAMRLTKLVCEHPKTASTDAHALLALMCYHAARFESRVGPDSEIVLLADQDRSTWNRELVSVGNACFARAELDGRPSAFVLEAAIAAQHVHAASFDETPWSYLLTLYDALYALKPTPTVWLNRCVVKSEADDPASALVELGRVAPEMFGARAHLYHCVAAQLHERLGDDEKRRNHLQAALRLAGTEAERTLIRKRLR